MMTDCIFCGIARKTVPADIVHEDDQVVAFRDASPQAPVHLLVIPKTHIGSLDELDDETLGGKLLGVCSRVGTSNDRESHGYRVITNAGPQAEVPHLHFHVLGGKPSLGPLAA